MTDHLDAAVDLADLLLCAEQLRIPPQDIPRILKRAELTTTTFTPAALEDLDCDYRAGACMVGSEWHFSGEPLGKWKGRTILLWPNYNRPQNRHRNFREIQNG